MADNSERNGNHGVVLNVEVEANRNPPPPASEVGCTVPFTQKLMAEVLGTYFLIFAGCASVVVNVNNEKVVSLPGISIVWGLAVMVLVYSVGHISGAHFNPAVTIAFAACKRFPLKQVPAYITAQVFGSTMAAGTLHLLFSGTHDVFTGTSPQGSDLQAFVIEFIITFLPHIGELAGLADGATVLLNVLFAGYLILSTGYRSINEPSKELGPCNSVESIQGIMDIYLTAPIIGVVSGAWTYNLVRYTDKPLREITKSASFLKSSRNSN
ncbi:hypothetical protein V6N11_047843 [Hibiscus sabdariffa]|uniref:Uncharacterized protein n=1 Tax=Hibiscus sabdariffa TaxID=183260 RepID=A0ABR2P857_9ROSI